MARRRGAGALVVSMIGSMALLTMVLPAPATAGAQTTTPTAPPLPTTITPSPPGSHGYPYDAVPSSILNLSSVGYAQQEYIVSGVTDTYQESGTWASDGQWGVSVTGSNVPYKTRILVRYPTDPAKFNGEVVFEWTNITTGGDQDPIWAQMMNEITQGGFAYVAVTAQQQGMSYLDAWDPERYASLGDNNDSQSYDIFTAAAEAVAADYKTILGGDRPTELIGAGDSQSAFRIDTYVNAFQPIDHVFNAFIAVGRWAGAAPIGDGFVGGPDPSFVRTDNTARFIQVNSQGDIEEIGAAVARQSDNADLRTWEVAGTSHIDDHEAGYEVTTELGEYPSSVSLIPQCVGGTPIEGTGTAFDGANQADNMPLWEVEDAALADMQTWLSGGLAAPHEPSQMTVTPILLGLFDLVPTNQYGIASGGIQLPEAQVPTEDFSPINLDVSNISLTPSALLGDLDNLITLYATGGTSITEPTGRDVGLCLLSGYFTNLSSSTLKALYPTDADYIAKYTAAVNSLVSERFMTASDGAAAIANAEAGHGPVQGPPAETVP